MILIIHFVLQSSSSDKTQTTILSSDKRLYCSKGQKLAKSTNLNFTVRLDPIFTLMSHDYSMFIKHHECLYHWNLFINHISVILYPIWITIHYSIYFGVLLVDEPICSLHTPFTRYLKKFNKRVVCVHLIKIINTWIT